MKKTQYKITAVSSYSYKGNDSNVVCYVSGYADMLDLAELFMAKGLLWEIYYKDYENEWSVADDIEFG